MRYETYINSQSWYFKKRELYERRGYLCERCGENRKGFLNVHHTNYLNLGKEEEKDLVILCRNCHAEYHAKFGKEPDIFTSRLFLKNDFGESNNKKRKQEIKDAVRQSTQHLKRQIREEKGIAHAKFMLARLELKQGKVKWAMEQMEMLRKLKT